MDAAGSDTSVTLAVAQQDTLQLATFDDRLARVAQALGVQTLR